MCGKKIRDPLGSSQTLVKCFPGSTNTSTLVIKPAHKVKELGPEGASAESRQVRTAAQTGSASVPRVAHRAVTPPEAKTRAKHGVWYSVQIFNET